jgi:hypothetical protein
MRTVGCILAGCPRKTGVHVVDEESYGTTSAECQTAGYQIMIVGPGCLIYVRHQHRPPTITTEVRELDATSLLNQM